MTTLKVATTNTLLKATLLAKTTTTSTTRATATTATTVTTVTTAKTSSSAKPSFDSTSTAVTKQQQHIHRRQLALTQQQQLQNSSNNNNNNIFIDNTWFIYVEDETIFVSFHLNSITVELKTSRSRSASILWSISPSFFANFLSPKNYRHKMKEVKR